ncbi:MAG: Peptidase family [Blastococcus sp.]|jgi:hypothetical protein|nr:Peptidase family [Blastococcus sp.]
MSTHQEPQGPAEPAEAELVRARLRTLAEASGLPVPPMAVDKPRKEDRLPRVGEIDGEQTVLVPRSLLTASPPRQLWYLAACLGRLVSPEPRRRHRLGGLFLVLLLVAYLVLLFAARPPWLWITVLVLYPVGAWALRWERRAMEDAGRSVLAAAGHPPVEVARAAFGADQDPPFLTRLLSPEPAPSRRIAAAEAASGADPSA